MSVRVAGRAKAFVARAGQGLRRGVKDKAPGRLGRGDIDESSIWPGIVEGTNNRVRLETFSAIVGEGKGRRLLDLGCGPGYFSKQARDNGWDVTAIDARTERLSDDLDGIRFVQADVREADVSGYHTIAILGLLYHLRLSEQEQLLRACSYARVILETQVHVAGHVPPASKGWGGKIVVEDGLEGVLYPENVELATASVGNPTSFWATEPSLLELFQRTGYDKVQVVQPMHNSKYGPRRFYILNTGR